MVRWQPEHGTRIGVISRDGEHDRVRWFPVENRFVMHVLNAYNDGDAIVVDYVHRPSFEHRHGGRHRAARRACTAP